MSQPSARRTSGRQAQQRGRKKSNLPLIIGGVVALLVIMIVAGMLLSGGGTAVGEQIPNQVGANGAIHIETPESPHPAYNSNPPTSGWHVGSGIGPWGVTTQPIADEITVHNLEHGGVIIHYRQDLEQAKIDQLAKLTRTLQQQSPCVLLIPRAAEKLDKPIAVTAWNWLLKLDDVDEAQITSFFRQRVNRGPELVGCALRS